MYRSGIKAVAEPRPGCADGISCGCNGLASVRSWPLLPREDCLGLSIERLTIRLLAANGDKTMNPECLPGFRDRHVPGLDMGEGFLAVRVHLLRHHLPALVPGEVLPH